MENKNFWYELIEKFQKAEIFKTGLTIPFLLGAYKMRDDEEKLIKEVIRRTSEI
ncbi:MAG: hypothetical protein LBU62_03530 [Bacteroidales bacterium]|jgi:hypothetical protein|nr:hypothetical protein [Bacteroidales bacterium]